MGCQWDEGEIFKIVYPSGAPILPNLSRYQVLVEDPVGLCGAVKHYSCALDALYLPEGPGSYDRQTQRLQNPGNNR
jgi:hypothetical protein